MLKTNSYARIDLLKYILLQLFCNYDKIPIIMSKIM